MWSKYDYGQIEDLVKAAPRIFSENFWTEQNENESKSEISSILAGDLKSLGREKIQCFILWNMHVCFFEYF